MKCISKALLLLCTLIISVTFNLTFAQKSGYPVEAYLSQINISDISISPNGKYIAVITNNDNFKTNTTEKKLWYYEITEHGTIVSKVEIPIYENAVSQLNWTTNSDFLLFMSKDKTGNNLFKIATKAPKKIIPVLNNKNRLEKLTSYNVLDNNDIIFVEGFSPEKIKKDSIFIKLPYSKDIKHSIFKRFSFGSNKVNTLFTIKLNVDSFKMSPNEEEILYSNYERSKYYTASFYSDSHTYIINSSSGEQIKQVTNDAVWDDIRWYTDDSVLTMYYGDPEFGARKLSYNQLYKSNLKTNSKEKLTKNFNGRIRGLLQWENKSILINAEQSTTSNFYTIDNTTVKQVSDLKGTIGNFVTNKNKNLMAFSLMSNSAFEDVYIARSIGELKSPIKITNFNKTLNKYEKPVIEKISWKNSSGESIEGVLMWPPGKKGKKNLPFVVDIHGGPWSSRSEAISITGVQYYYYASLLASRGFLVLQPNYSGSTGRSQEFVDAINGASMTKPTGDILTGVQYIINKKWADKDKMVVKGASYGGLLTNSIIGETNLFKAALPSCGVWDESASYGTGDGDGAEYILFKGITVWDNPELYAKESPIKNIKKIKTPTLITHGEKDVRVPTHNAYAMYYALKEMNVDVELLILKGQGHLYKTPSSKLAKTKAELEFINKYIKF